MNSGFAGCSVRPSRAIEINSGIASAFFFEFSVERELACFFINIHDQ